MTGGLIVYWDNRVVGALERHAEGTMLFRYVEPWLDSPDARPISAAARRIGNGRWRALENSEKQFKRRLTLSLE